MWHSDGHAFRRVTALFCALLVVLVIGRAKAEETSALKGVALVIGQSAYETLTPLPNPERDARDFEDLLAKLGFATDLATDAKAKKLRRSVEGFIEDAEGADVALIYYSGHGIEASGVNYLIPIDADQSSLDAADESLISLQSVLEQLRQKARITILLLDACRSNPFPKEALIKPTAASAGEPIAASGLGAPRGALVVETTASPDSIGEVIGFAAEPGQAALDGAAGANSPYAAALLKHLAANQGYDFGQVMTMVTEEVYLATSTRQRPWTNASLRRFLSFGGTVVDSSPDETLLSGERRKLLLAIAATPQDMRDAVESLAKGQSLPLDPLYGMLRELQVDTSAGRDELDKQLRIGADNLKKLLADKVLPLRKDAELVRLAGLADRAQAEGAIGLAKDYRAKAASRADALDKTLDQREAEVAADRIELASTYADYAETAILAFDYRTAAEQYAKAYEQVADRDKALAFRYKYHEATALADHGDYKGDNAALMQSLALFKQAMAFVEHAKDRHHWAMVQNDLGNALVWLGDREGDGGSLNQAIVAYEAALTVWTRERAPLDWAVTQSNLGNAFLSLGERGSDAFLHKAVAAYEAALTVRTRESAPLDWAATQNNLGNAFQRLGERESGRTFLTKAVAAYEAALTVRSRESVPLDWASTQHNLGAALQELSERENGTGSLSKAVSAYEAALMVRTRETAPLDWAATQSNLGLALLTLGEWEKNDELVNRAIAAHEAALTERTRDRVPLGWAASQNNLGLALRSLGLRENGTASLTIAVTAYRQALEEATRERVPLDWAQIQHNLGLALHTIAERESGTESLLQAIAALRSALNERTRERAPRDWADTQDSLGIALRILNERTGNTLFLTQAIAAFEAALTERTRELAPFKWALTQKNLAIALTLLARSESGTASLAKAAAACEAALSVLTREDGPLAWAVTQNNLGVVLYKLGVRNNDIGALSKAIAAHEESLVVWTRESLPHDWAEAQHNIGRAKLALGLLTGEKAMIVSGRLSVQAAWDTQKAAGITQYDSYFQGRLQEFDAALAKIAN